MRITITRSGGFAGLTQEWSVQIDDGSADEEQWRELIERLPWDRAMRPRVGAPTGEADRFVYRVRCAGREATIPERRLTGPWRELVDRVRETETTGES